MTHEPVTVSDTQKVDLSIMVFYIRYFAAQFFNDLPKKKPKVMNNTMCP